ncbi:MAG: cysteine desulfurase [Bacteroidaceae bacterium]|nr:cysteine desulfurase [Bacteroidaceae bacterium]
MFDIQKIREDFPILGREVYGRPLVYLDNGATTQKPRCVIDAMTDEYLNVNANVHRGVHYLSQQATELHEQARETVRRFINARSTAEIVFTRGTTESINLVASSFGQAFLHDGDEVILTEMEHHSNIVPWQLLQARMDLRIKVCPISDDGRLNLSALEQLFTPRTRLLACTAVSNVLGTVNPASDIIAMAHAHDVPVLIDAAQAAPHMPIDVQALDCDFLAFSGHKVYGPTGIGVLYGKEKWLDRMPPYMGGGEMIGKVSFERTTFNVLPYKFEAGTPDYVATTGLAKALDYVSAIGLDTIMEHERTLTNYALRRLAEIPGMRIFGPQASSPQQLTGPDDHDAVISFLVGDIHHLDLGTLLDRLGIAVRTGHHCAEPLMHRLGIEGTVRASFALYNTCEEVDALVAAILRVMKMF